MERSTSLTNFLRQFWLTWLGFTPRVLRQVSPQEPLARYVTQRRQFLQLQQAFLPSPRDNSLSVFRTVGLRERSIWAIGRAVVWRRKNAVLCGRADFLASAAVDLQLSVRGDLVPPRHASITGWPPIHEKPRAKHLAQVLAAAASLKELA